MRDTYAVINLDNIRYNLNQIKNHTNKHVFAVVKADGYGHGVIEVVKALTSVGVEYLCVAFIDEACYIRDNGFENNILIMGPINHTDLKLASEKNITITIFDIEWLRNLNIDFNIKVHLKIDTGMNRIGIHEDDLKEALKIVKNNPLIELEGVYTHYATADEEDESYYQMQANKFRRLLDIYKIDCKYIHSQNSAATLRYKEPTNSVRPGLILYGFKPCGYDDLDLKPAFALETTVMMIHPLKRGESISYGATYTASNDELVAVLPIGYADGWIRAHQGRQVFINGKSYEMIGRICMDQTLVRVDESVSVKDKVELFGNNITLDDVAKDLDTINYEIICMIGKRVKRKYTGGGEF